MKEVLEILDPAQHAASIVVEMLQHLEQTKTEPSAVRKVVFRDLQRQLHPDKNSEIEEAAKIAFQKLMELRSQYL